MNGKKGLSRIMSALLAASSMIGGASAADVKRPAGKVKVGKNVVRKERKKKAKSAELDVGGRERRGEAINAYASPLDNPRNLADAVLGVSTLGLGITAFYKHRKALEERSLKDVALGRQAGVALFCTFAKSEDCDIDEALLFCRLSGDCDVTSLRYKLCGSGDRFCYAAGGTLGDKVEKEKVVWSDGKFFYNFEGSNGVFVGPVARTLRDDINVFVDRCLLGITESLKVEVKTNVKENHTIVDFRTHLMQSVDEQCENLGTEGNSVKAEEFKKLFDAIFHGADWVREYLHENLSKLEEKYNEQFKTKEGDGEE